MVHGTRDMLYLYMGGFQTIGGKKPKMDGTNNGKSY